LIVLIANAHHLFGLANLSSSLALEGVQNPAIRANLKFAAMGCIRLTIMRTQTARLPFTTALSMMPSTCST